MSRAYDRASVSLKIVSNDVGAQPEVLDQPLRRLNSDRGVVTIPDRETGRDHLEHVVAYPTDLRMAESEEGDVMAGLRFELVDHLDPLPVIAGLDEVSRRLLARFSPDGGDEPPSFLVPAAWRVVGSRPIGASRQEQAVRA